MVYFAKDLQTSYEFFINDPVLMELAGDILTHPEFIGMGEFYSHKYEIRLKHLMNVAYYSVKLSRFLRGDTETTLRAALLHDFYPYQRYKKDTNYVKHLKTHAGESLANAQNFFLLSSEVQEIILRHHWPFTRGKPKRAEAFIVISVDWIVATMENFYHRGWRNPKNAVRVVGRKSKQGMKFVGKKTKNGAKKISSKVLPNKKI
jgi:Predicted HD superfamily hydrolase